MEGRAWGSREKKGRTRQERGADNAGTRRGSAREGQDDVVVGVGEAMARSAQVQRLRSETELS